MFCSLVFAIICIHACLFGRETRSAFESAWLPPCMVLVINDNLYGLMFVLSYICRCVHWVAWSPFVGIKVKGRRKVCVDQGFVRVDHHSRPSEDMPKSASPILVDRGVISESSPSEAQSRKVVHLEEMKIVFIDLKWINAQGKGMILIGFLFYWSHDVSERPDYRIVNYTIKRGSRPSILIV